MAVLVVADHDNAQLRESTARAVSAALQLSTDADVLVAGAEAVRPVAEAAAKIEGVRKVRLAVAASLNHGLAESHAALIASIMGDYDAVVMVAGSESKDIAPRLAALCDVAPICDVIRIEAPDIFVRPIYAGNALETVRSRDAKKIITLRSSAFATRGTGNDAPIEMLNVPAHAARASFVSEQITRSERPDLSAARVVVSGGRAMGSAEEFHAQLEPLADALGAAIGASRAAVDAGYVPNDFQVGQTGKVVAPELYIAIGISGAIQHLAGMKDSKIIVAINKDAEAPIMQLADYAWVADYKTAVPELLSALAARAKK
jgi:electron transfer flavoprotein alpha subunit